jgi:cell division protease FtsH
VAATIDDEVKLLVDKAYAQCMQILKDNEELLMQVVDFLMEHETMTGEQFAALMEGNPVEDASTTSMFDGVAKTEEQKPEE